MTEEKNIEDLIKNRVEITEKDEYMHDWGNFIIFSIRNFA